MQKRIQLKFFLFSFVRWKMYQKIAFSSIFFVSCHITYLSLLNEFPTALNVYELNKFISFYFISFSLLRLLLYLDEQFMYVRSSYTVKTSAIINCLQIFNQLIIFPFHKISMYGMVLVAVVAFDFFFRYVCSNFYFLLLWIFHFFFFIILVFSPFNIEKVNE